GQIAERRRQSFSARVLTRSASPLAPTFWTSLASDIDDDAGRLRAVASEALATALAAPEPRVAHRARPQTPGGGADGRRPHGALALGRRRAGAGADARRAGGAAGRR